MSCDATQLVPAQQAALQQAGVALFGYASYALALDLLVTLLFVGMGALIFWHRSRERMGVMGENCIRTARRWIHSSMLASSPSPLFAPLCCQILAFMTRVASTAARAGNHSESQPSPAKDGNE